MSVRVIVSVLCISYVTSCTIDCSVRNNRLFVGQEFKINCTTDDVKDIFITAIHSNGSRSELSTRILDARTAQGYIQNVGLQDSGWYSCCRNGCADENDMSDCCRVQVQEPLQPPRNFNCTSVDDNHMYCSWTEQEQCPDENTQCWQFSFLYFVNFIFGGDGICSNRSKQVSIKKVSNCAKSDGKVTCQISDTSYNSLYYMYLEAGDDKYKYEICNNDSILKLTLQKLEVVAASSTRIDLTWEMAISGFEIVCEINATSQWGSLFTERLHYGYHDPMAADYTLDDLHPYTEYTVHVQCSVIASIYPGEPKVGKNRTHPSVPLIGPVMTNTSYVPCGKQCLMFYLQEPSLYFAQGKLSGFTLQQDSTFFSYNLTSNIKVNRSSDFIRIWSENMMGRSKASTQLLIPGDGEEFTEIGYVYVTYNSFYKHYTVKCHLVEMTEEEVEYVFHRCSGTFTTEDQLCLGKYNFTTSSKKEMNISSDSSDETFGVSVAAPIRSKGIHWQDISDPDDQYEPATVNYAVKGGDNSGAIAAVIIAIVLLLILITFTIWKCRENQSNYDIDIPEIEEKNISNGVQQNGSIELVKHRTLMDNIPSPRDVNELNEEPNGSLSPKEENETSLPSDSGEPLLHNEKRSENRSEKTDFTSRNHDGYFQEHRRMNIDPINQQNAENKASNPVCEQSTIFSDKDGYHTANIIPVINSYSRITQNYFASSENEMPRLDEEQNYTGIAESSGSVQVNPDKHSCSKEHGLITFADDVSVVSGSDSISGNGKEQNTVDSDHYVTVAINLNNNFPEADLQNSCTESFRINNDEQPQEYFFIDKDEMHSSQCYSEDAGQIYVSNSFIKYRQQASEQRNVNCTHRNETAMQMSSDMDSLSEENAQDNTGTLQIPAPDSHCKSEGDKSYVSFNEPGITRNTSRVDNYVTKTVLNLDNHRVSALDPGCRSTTNDNVVNREKTPEHDFNCTQCDKTTMQVSSDTEYLSEESAQDNTDTLPAPNSHCESKGDNPYVSFSEPAITLNTNSMDSYVTTTVLSLDIPRLLASDPGYTTTNVNIVSSDIEPLSDESAQDNMGTFQLPAPDSHCENKEGSTYVSFSEAGITLNTNSMDSYVTTTVLNLDIPRLPTSDPGYPSTTNVNIVNREQTSELDSNCMYRYKTAMQVSSDIEHLSEESAQDNTGTFQLPAPESHCDSKGDNPYVSFSEPEITLNTNSVDSYVTTTVLNLDIPRLPASEPGYKSTTNVNVSMDQTSEQGFYCTECDKTAMQVSSDTDSLSEESVEDNTVILGIPTPHSYCVSKEDNPNTLRSEPASARVTNSSDGYVTSTMLALSNHN